MPTVHVSIGNSDGKLSHADWARFYSLVDLLVAEKAATHVHGRWHSLPATPYVNACWAVEIPDDQVEALKGQLGWLAQRFGQDAIAWLSGVTELIEAKEGF